MNVSGEYKKTKSSPFANFYQTVLLFFRNDKVQKKNYIKVYLKYSY